MSSSKPPARQGIVVAPERVERALRAHEERGRLEREFEVSGDLGQGGMGAVLRARDLRLCREVAVKVLAPALRVDRSSPRRFLVEAQVVAQLEHPNIVPLYALACDDSGKPGLVMRLIGGESFRTYLDASATSAKASLAEPHDLASRIERFLKACDAMEYAHARGVVHRDLKPENVMLGAHNEVYVVDWGLAKVVGVDEADSEDFADLTDVGKTVGTPMYMAPEQARGSREDVGPASDQYALGLLLQELATLRPPRRGETREALMKAAARGDRAPFRHRFGEKLPPALGAIVAKATSMKPADRYADVADFARDVRRFARGEAVLARPDTIVAAAWRWLRRRPEVVLGFILASTLIASAAVTIALTRELSARDRMEERSRRMASLTARVARTAAAVDARAAIADVIVEGLAAAAVAELQRKPAAPDDHLSPQELAKDEAATAYVARYHQRVNFTHVVTVLAPDTPAGTPVLAHAGDYERVLFDAAVRAAGGDGALGLPRGGQVAMVRERSSVQWTEIGFESGVLFVYPGNTFFPADYDVRKRPWYTLVAGARGHRWGSPHIDATSGALIIPCAAPLFDDADAFLGVANLHLALDELLARIALDDTEGFRESAVLDDRGDVVFSTGERGRNLGVGTHENRPLERTPFAVAAVRERIGAGARDGLVHDGDRIVVFQRFGAFPWTLAVTFAAAPYDRL